MSLIIVSNREPLQKQNGTWQPSVGGLTTALLPVLEARGGTWVAWGEEDAETVSHLDYPEDDPVLGIERIHLSDAERDKFYYGFANQTLWPLCHYFTERLVIDHSFWQGYQAINRRFVARTSDAYSAGDCVWIQDYHLLLTPQLLRERHPDTKIGFFLHIPFPAPEVWQMLPWADELIHGLLGSDVIGFHRLEYARNFCQAAQAVGADWHEDATLHYQALHYQGRTIRAVVQPIGIDTERFAEIAARDSTQQHAEHFKHDFKSDYLIIGVDRLDYSKGVPERLLAFEIFLQDNPDYRGKVSFYQVAAPSRTNIDAYQQLKRNVDEIAGRINATYMTNDWVPVRYFNRKHPQEELIGIYLAADVAMITPYRDGMNIVAQEFAWTSQRGALVLSHLTGAIEILPEAITVNPLDIAALAEGIKRGLELPEDERQTALAAMRERIKNCDVHQWADRFLEALG